MFGEGGSFIAKAKDKGLQVVGDVFIPLSADQIVSDEEAHNPDWADKEPKQTTLAQTIQANQNLLNLSDFLICPSEFVRDDLLKYGVDLRRTLVVPYAVGAKWLDLEVEPQPGRVLFAGTASLRKGIHHLAAAATLLKGQCKIRVAGAVSERVRNHPEARDLAFLGHLGPFRMAEEFARADVFAFPSLVEGSAGVTGEALGAGLPVVATRAAGSIVRDGVDGLIIPERHPEALAQAIMSIVLDRDRREAMSQAARQRAQVFTWDGFVHRVIQATIKITK